MTCQPASVAEDISTETMAKIFKALGHPTRLRIVEYLIHVDTCVCGEIVDIFPYSQSTISQHLKQLKASGIVCGEVEGPRTHFCVDKAILKAFRSYVHTIGKKGTPC